MGMTRTSIPYALILGIAALACSRLLFWMIQDPEGPNLLVVTAMAAILFLLSMVAWFSKPLASLSGPMRVSAAVLVQILLSAGFYILLR